MIQEDVMLEVRGGAVPVKDVGHLTRVMTDKGWRSIKYVTRGMRVLYSIRVGGLKDILVSGLHRLYMYNIVANGMTVMTVEDYYYIPTCRKHGMYLIDRDGGRHHFEVRCTNRKGRCVGLYFRNPCTYYYDASGIAHSY